MDKVNAEGGQQKTVVDGIFSNKNSKGVLPLVPPPDAEAYTKYKSRGTALIFNHKYFTDKNMTRYGTEKDRDALQETFDELKFDVKIFEDQTYDEIMEVLRIVSKMDHSENECLVIAVMSHGEDGVLYAKDETYPTKNLWTYFSPVHCPSLAGKPKLFFIQACRGNKSDPGVKVSYIEMDSSNSTKNKVYTIPVMADILVMYATVEEYYAWRDVEKGSYFIQALADQLRKHHRTKDLLSILTCVNRAVAIDFNSSEPNEPHLSNKKEMCSIVSMLTRSFYFH